MLDAIFEQLVYAAQKLAPKANVRLTANDVTVGDTIEGAWHCKRHRPHEALSKPGANGMQNARVHDVAGGAVLDLQRLRDPEAEICNSAARAAGPSKKFENGSSWRSLHPLRHSDSLLVLHMFENGSVSKKLPFGKPSFVCQSRGTVGELAACLDVPGSQLHTSEQLRSGTAPAVYLKSVVPHSPAIKDEHGWQVVPNGEHLMIVTFSMSVNLVEHASQHGSTLMAMDWSLNSPCANDAGTPELRIEQRIGNSRSRVSAEHIKLRLPLPLRLLQPDRSPKGDVDSVLANASSLEFPFCEASLLWSCPGIDGSVEVAKSPSKRGGLPGDMRGGVTAALFEPPALAMPSEAGDVCTTKVSAIHRVAT